MLNDPLFYLAAIPAVLITSISKGSMGMGLGIAALPLLALVLPPDRAAGVLLPLLCLMDLFTLYLYRGQWEGRVLRIAVPGALVGIVVGMLSFREFSPHLLRLQLGIIAMGFTLFYWLGGAQKLNPQPLSAPKGIFWSGLSGFTSFVAHGGGPPFSVFLLPLRLDKARMVGTTTVFFALVNFLKVVPYFYLGQFSEENLRLTAVLVPAVPAGVFLGWWLQNRMDTALFYRIAYLFVFIVGIKLFMDGASHYLLSL
ncbi:MAG: sulfite exporter TauE/SafE family protein [Deltaproteobacteria bacterium]|nr:sulfite exporter TauE/SafE family protein [Deltaproteobacteria bacterium]